MRGSGLVREQRSLQPKSMRLLPSLYTCELLRIGGTPVHRRGLIAVVHLPHSPKPCNGTLLVDRRTLFTQQWAHKIAEYA